MRAAAFLLALGCGAVEACGFHGALGDGFSAMHPRSLQVAFALQDAVEAGLVERPAVTPAGYARAVLRLNVAQRRLSGSAAPISILLVDSGLWTQLDPLVVHATGPRPGDVIVLTSEPVLAALLDGRLPIAAALERGLVVVDGDVAPAGAVGAMIRKGLVP